MTYRLALENIETQSAPSRINRGALKSEVKEFKIQDSRFKTYDFLKELKVIKIEN